MAVDHRHKYRYSTESERANLDIYDYFNFEKPFGLHCLYERNSALEGLSQWATETVFAKGSQKGEPKNWFNHHRVHVKSDRYMYSDSEQSDKSGWKCLLDMTDQQPWTFTGPRRSL